VAAQRDIAAAEVGHVQLLGGAQCERIGGEQPAVGPDVVQRAAPPCGWRATLKVLVALQVSIGET
jgi:hypothetical protein